MVEYLRNAWYAAAFSDEVLPDAPFRRTLLDTPIVIYRQEDRTPVALHDRCPHRFAPLSQGRVIGNDIQCPYHGLRFDAAGACSHNPHAAGGGPLKAAAVTAYPAMERHGIIWFWPGDPARAAPAALPSIPFLEEGDRFATVKGLLHVKGHYELIVDNLLDLSHASFIHPQFGAAGYSPEELLAATTVKLERRERSIVNHRMRSGLPAPPPSQRMFGLDPSTPTHSRMTMTWHPPAMLYFDAGTWEEGATEESGAWIPQLHAITPETERTSHYFFVNGRNLRKNDPEVDRMLLEMFDMAFRQQDEPIIEFVQAQMGDVTDIMTLRPVLLATDAAPVSARRMLARLIAEERTGAGDDAAPASAPPEGVSAAGKAGLVRADCD